MVTTEQVYNALETVMDPEIGFNVVDLGLIYDVRISDAGAVEVDATLTSMGCPMGPQMMMEMHDVIEKLPGVTSVAVKLVWEPMWTPDMMKEELRWLLGR
ncbi:MAG TPA: metal-sulfur cluster assembly factor [Firmicutes bacterium]|jgi:metal-sulfur cluster biosynthetic enzyme|nr:metal-sulfur cluster assembly factor [Bacillota bacterium]